MSLPEAHDLIRIYYSFFDSEGESCLEPLATLLVECSQPTRDGRTVRGSLDCYSVLKVLADRQYGLPFTIPAGTQAVAKAVELIESVGLQCSNPEASGYSLASDHTFDEDATYLEIVNWLLAAAGFSSVVPDAYGTVQIRQYVEPTERPISMTFRDDEQSIMYPEVTVTRDWASIPNVCRLFYQTDEESLWAYTRNVDTASELSVAVRGREVTLFDSVSELPGDTREERLEALKSASKTRLLDNSSEVEYVAFSCAWTPLAPNDAIEVAYEAADLRWKGAITNMRIDLGVAVPCQIEARRFIRTGIETETEGGVL